MPNGADGAVASGDGSYRRPRGRDRPVTRLRVLWLIKGLGPGGAERLLSSFAQASDLTRFDYEIAYLLRAKQALVAELEGHGVATHCLDARGRISWAMRLRRLLIARPVDIVHMHSPLAAAVTRLVVRSLPRSVRPRLVSTEHNVWPSYATPTRLANALTFGLDDAHIAVSNQVRRSVPARWRDGVEVVVHGVPLDEARAQRPRREEARAGLGVGPDEILVGTIANFRADKAYPDLLRAARKALESGLPLRFVAVGQGPLDAEIRRDHAELNLGDSFRLLGYRPDALFVLAGCDIFVLASLREGLPVAVMEALAIGLPVVATDVGGVADALADSGCGVIVPPGRPDLLAAAIIRLGADDELRASMAQKAVERGDAFDIIPAVRRIESLYREVVDAPDPTGSRRADCRR